MDFFFKWDVVACTRALIFKTTVGVYVVHTSINQEPFVFDGTV
jgi:hypothetical protein